jgi:hypothetical protein
MQLMLYMDEDSETNARIALLEALLRTIANGAAGNIAVQVGQVSDEAELFAVSDYYVTSRALATVRRSCLADRFGLKVLSGVDEPLFHEMKE